MSGVDWGNVPAWCSAILTSGSLMLGFYILLRDRRKEEKAEARKLVFNLRGNGDQWTLTAHNASDRPFTDIRMLTQSLGRSRNYHFPTAFLLPKESDTLSWPKANRVGLAVLFEDADGTRWVKNLMTQELLRIPESSLKARILFKRVWQNLPELGG
ncbi:hypothetical protein ACFV7R_10180 [Streptomyces sp. NPDC059866]|uniref:hypothetical protein n=1 Tax=Streptomyces sp. NPDC059866 TaxID=3346978 RepID=UPI0036621E09